MNRDQKITTAFFCAVLAEVGYVGNATSVAPPENITLTGLFVAAAIGVGYSVAMDGIDYLKAKRQRSATASSEVTPPALENEPAPPMPPAF